ncbi:MAG: ATP-binding protein [Nitrospiraceae bacterium]|nr:ATP-binding protein [Nitrospiraceae bacterium]
MLIVMAGLPGTGKTAVATALGKAIGATVLNKDMIRQSLFPPGEIDYSRSQDDLCFQVLFLLAEYSLARKPGHPVIIDGRTFSRADQVKQISSWAATLKMKPIFIECRCDDAVARERLDHDQRTGAHPAANRSFGLYQELKAAAEPIEPEHLVIDTGRESLEQSVAACLAYLNAVR